MRTIIQTPAAGTDFDGTTDNGLITFADLPLVGGAEDQVPIIMNIALENTFTEALTSIDCFLKEASAGLTTTRRITILRVLNQEGFSLAGCHIEVPRLVLDTPAVFTRGSSCS